MKKTIIISTLLLSGFAFSQVGVHTPDPKATFDITAKNATGTSAAPEGILIPRVDRQRAQFMIGVRASTLIYINSVDTGSQTGTAINIDAPGYYYFDGTVWVKFTKNNGSNATNIYNANGLLTGNRTVSQGANRLAFTGNTVNAFSVAGNTFSIDAENKRVGIGTSNPKAELDLGTEAPTDPTDPAGKKLAVYNNNNFTSFYGLGASENLLQFHASSASNGAPAMVLNNEQNVGIGTTAPNANALLDLSSSNKGFLMPRLTTAQRDAINPKVPGLAIYNSTLNCMQYWDSNTWRGKCQATIERLNCTSATFSPATITAGTPYSGTMTVPYTGGNGGSYPQGPSQTINGLTFRLQAGTLNVGSGNLIYTVTGTPTSVVTMNIPVSFNGATICNVNKTVQLPPTPPPGTACYIARYTNDFSTSFSTPDGGVTGNVSQRTPITNRSWCQANLPRDFNQMNASTTVSWKLNKPVGSVEVTIDSYGGITNTRPTFWRNNVQVFPSQTFYNSYRCTDTRYWRNTFEHEGVWIDEIRYTADRSSVVQLCLGRVSP